MNAREKHPLGFCVVTGWLRQVQADDFFVTMKCVCGVEHLLRPHFPLAPCSTSPSLVPDLRFEANDWQVSMHHCQSCPHAAKTPFPYPPPPRTPTFHGGIALNTSHTAVARKQLGLWWQAQSELTLILILTLTLTHSLTTINRAEAPVARQPAPVPVSSECLVQRPLPFGRCVFWNVFNSVPGLSSTELGSGKRGAVAMHVAVMVGTSGK